MQELKSVDHKIKTAQKVRQWIMSLPLISKEQFESLEAGTEIIHEIDSKAVPVKFIGLEQDGKGFTLVRFETPAGSVFKRTWHGWHLWRARSEAELLDQEAGELTVELAQEILLDPLRQNKGFVKELPQSREVWKKA